MAQVRAYVRNAIQGVYQFETPEQLQEEGVEVILGTAEFRDATTIRIGDRIVRSKNFLLTTGARPLTPQIAGEGWHPVFPAWRTSGRSAANKRETHLCRWRCNRRISVHALCRLAGISSRSQCSAAGEFVRSYRPGAVGDIY